MRVEGLCIWLSITGSLIVGDAAPLPAVVLLCVAGLLRNMCSLAAAADAASDDAMASSHPKNKADGPPRGVKSEWRCFHRSLGQRLVNARQLYCQSVI
jgi:hypothetical protein